MDSHKKPIAKHINCHARRKFFELYDASKNTMAKEVLDHIAQLYQIESNIKAMSIDERERFRKAEANGLKPATWLGDTL